MLYTDNTSVMYYYGIFLNTFFVIVQKTEINIIMCCYTVKFRLQWQLVVFYLFGTAPFHIKEDCSLLDLLSLSVLFLLDRLYRTLYVEEFFFSVKRIFKIKMSNLLFSRCNHI